MSRASNPHQSGPATIGSFLRALTSYDFFPAFSAKVRRSFYNPLGVLLLVSMAALLCGLFLHPQGFVLLGGLLAVVVLGTIWPWLSLRGLSGSITFERTRAAEGERVEVSLTLRNRLPWSAWGLAVRGGFVKHATGEEATTPVASVAFAPRWCVARCRWWFVPACRGVYPLTAPCLTTGFPFGLWENQRIVAVEAPLVVWPRTFPVGPVPLAGGNRLVEGNVSRNKVGSNGDVLGVRPYRRGDTPRRIHWGQSARHDRLIVCELQCNARPLVQLVLDADPRVHAGRGPNGSREWAIRVVASMAKGWLEAGAQVAAVWNGTFLPAASGRRQLQRLLDSLSRLGDEPGPNLAETLACPACRGFGDGLQIIVTTDTALHPLGRHLRAADEQRWVVFRTATFDQPPRTSPEPPARLPVRPWLLIDAAERVPALLLGGWKEARHGS